MSAGKGKRVFSKTAPNTSAIEVVGRPPDDPLQSFFMKKLRDGKLQMINAQSDAEIASDKIKDLCPELIAKRTLKNNDDDYSQEKFGIVKDWFKKKMDPEHFNHLLNGFKEAVNKFEYRQIQSQKDFPEYLFMDELDLTYVLHHMLRSEIPQLKTKTEFSNLELFFLSLVCFAFRDMISFKTLEVLQKLHGQILHNMEGLKEKIHSHYEKTLLKKVSQLKNQEEMGIEEVQDEFIADNPISADLRKGQIHLSLEEIQKEEEEDSSKNQKTKKIQKPQKKARGRPKGRDIEKEMKKPVNPQDLQQIIQKLITFISWSYSYIYPEQLKKKKELKLV